MADAHKNFAASTIATAPSPAASGTTLSVSAGTGALFPAAPFNVTIHPAAASPTAANAEISRVTSKGSGDDWTVLRAQEGTTARTIIVGDQIANTATVKVFTDIEAILDGLPATYQPIDADLTAIAALSATGGWAKRTAANTWSISTPTAADVGALPAAAINLAASGAGGITGTLPVANGGTGVTSLTDGRILFPAGGVVGGSADLTWDGTTLAADRVSVGSPIGDMDPIIQGYTGVTRLLTRSLNDDAGIGLEVENSLGNTNGVYVAAVAKSAGSFNGIFESDAYLGANNTRLYNYGFYNEVNAGVSATAVYGMYQLLPVGLGAGATLNEYSAIWIGDQATSATNSYLLWGDGRAVRRIKYEADGNMVDAWYNVDFTKYTAGAVNFERLEIGKWTGNVVDIGPTAGGTGVLRGTRITGASLVVPSSFTIGSNVVSLAGAFTTSGANALILTTTGATDVTFPTTGTLATLAGAEAFTNKTGNISQWTNDSGYLTSVSAHNLLSATHGDTTAGTVARGDLITGQGASAKWVRLAKGTANQVLAMDGTATDVVWTTLSGGAGDALVANPLSQFAATTSLQLKGVISDETGSGALVFGTAPTLTGPVTLTGAVGSSAFTITGGTQTASFPVLDLSQTWNNSGVTFTGVKLNVTNTASAAASQFLALQLAGTDRTFFPRAGGMSFYSNINAGRIGVDDSNFGVIVSSSSADDFWFSSTSLRLKSTLTFGWASSSTTAVAGLDTILSREAAAILQMGLDVNGAAIAQTFKAHDGITGTNIAGANLTLAGGRGTGTGAPGNLRFQTAVQVASGTTAQTLGTRIEIIENKIGFFGQTPVAQGASVEDPVFGLTIDVEARLAIIALISRVEATGLIATI